MPHSPEVVLIDDGELEDVQNLLAELGADSVRLLRPGSLEDWSPPSRILIATARRALALRLQVQSENGGFTAIAVAADDSKTLRTLLRRLGFEYLVRRPVNRDALRMLLLRALYREKEKRRQPRFPFGWETTWRVGWNAHRGTLVEVSPTGCRLLAPIGVAPGSRVAIRIPSHAIPGHSLALGGLSLRIWGRSLRLPGRSLTLRGRVARCERDPSRSPAQQVALGVVFEGLSSKARERLGTLLAELTIGPAPLPGEAKAPETAASLPSKGSEPLQAPEPVPAHPDSEGAESEPASEADADDDLLPASGQSEAELPEPFSPTPTELREAERRRHARGALRQEVVALDEQTERVVHVLIGRDLSVSGLRVEPHPALAPANRLRLAIYDPSCGEPVIVDAEVIRDDGPRGFALRFLDLQPDAIGQIERIVSTLPAVEALRPDSAGPERVVLAQLLPLPAPDPAAGNATEGSNEESQEEEEGSEKPESPAADFPPSAEAAEYADRNPSDENPAPTE